MVDAIDIKKNSLKTGFKTVTMFDYMRNILILFSIILIVFPDVSAFDRQSLCVFKVDLNEKQELLKELEKEENFTIAFEITPATSIFKYNGEGTLTRAIRRVTNSYKEQIIDAEPVRIQQKTTKLEGLSSYDDRFSHKHLPDLTNSNYYGMGVEEAWSQGYTGKGVTIATMDVGIDKHLLDLERNIHEKLSYNFVENNTDVAAEHFYHDHPETFHLTNHGNTVASILAAVKGNNICSAGISFDATIVVLKVFAFVRSDKGNIEINPKRWTASDITARALVYKLAEIDIAVMAWSSVSPFARLDLATREALTYGAETGRRGLGRVYVVAAGPIGNELTNNIYTITVNGIGREGTVPKHAYGDTSAFVSGLSDGNNLTSTYMITTTVNNGCVTWFKGVSAATSQVAAIIGLALQANPSLTLRDIQHLLVQSAEHNGLDETYAFRRNGAGRHFHRFFGFGLVNATKLVTLAKTRQKAAERLGVKLQQMTKKFSEDGDLLEYKFVHRCNDLSKQQCLTVLEHVAVSLEFETSYTWRLRMHLTSPSGTRSTLMRATEELNGTTSGQLVSVNFWDELAFGEWTFNLHSISSLRNSSQINISRVSVILYGTNAIQDNVKGHNTVNVEYKTKRAKQQPDQPFHFLYVPNSTHDRALHLVIVLVPIAAIIVLAFVSVKFKRICLRLYHFIQTRLFG